MKEISIPSYMHSLPQESVDHLTSSSDSNSLIIACGIHPTDGSLMMITGTAGVYSIAPNGKMRPRDAFPVQDGRYMKIVFNHPYGMHIISSSAALSIAKDEMLDTELLVHGKSMGTLSNGDD